MASIGSLIIDLVAKTGSFETDLGRAARTAEKRSKEIDRSISRLGSRIAASFAGLAAGFSFAAIIRETVNAEQEIAQLDAVIKSTGEAAGLSRVQLLSMADDFATATTHSSGEIVKAQTRLLAYSKIVGEQFPRALQAAIDQSVRLGIGIEQSTEIIGRALETPSKGVASLSKQGFNFTEQQKKVLKSLEDTGRSAEAQSIILDVLEESYGGAAAAARNTLGGALSGLKNSFNDLLTVGSGIPGTTAAINKLSAALSDPATKASADSFGSAIISALTAIGSIAALALKPLVNIINAASLLGTEMDMAFGRDFDTGTQLNVIGEKLEALGILRDSLLHPPGDPGALIGPHELEQVERLSKEIDLLKGKRDALQYQPGTSSGPSRRGTPAIDVSTALPSEEFTKLAEKLNEQIALHGKVGEAAKLAYAIQSGTLEGLSDSEEKQLLALARRADAVAASTEAQKKAAEEQKKAAEEQKKALADQEQARESIESLVAGLRQQVATFEQGEAAVIRYRIEHGDLAETFNTASAAAEPYKQELIELTDQLDEMAEATKRNAEEAAKFDDALARGDAIVRSLRTPQEEYADTLKELNDLKGKGALLEHEYARAVIAAQDALDEATNKWTVFKDQAARNTQDIIADTLVNGFDKGAKGILDSFANMITQLAAQAIAADIAGKLFGKSGGGEGGGWIDAAISLFSGFGGGRAFGGPVDAGTMYRVNEREPEFFKPNVAGKVIPLSRMSGMGGTQSNVTQNITVAGRADLRTARQIQIEAARMQRIATSKLG